MSIPVFCSWLILSYSSKLCCAWINAYCYDLLLLGFSLKYLQKKNQISLIWAILVPAAESSVPYYFEQTHRVNSFSTAFDTTQVVCVCVQGGSFSIEDDLWHVRAAYHHHSPDTEVMWPCSNISLPSTLITLICKKSATRNALHKLVTPLPQNSSSTCTPKNRNTHPHKLSYMFGPAWLVSESPDGHRLWVEKRASCLW